MSVRVLHVAESFGGGVFSSVLAMVEATPDLEHHLALWPWRTHPGTGDRLAAFASLHTLPRRPEAAVRGLRHLVDALAPRQVHAHSSYAGALVRLRDLGTEVVYSPHCFAFERGDLSPAARSGLRRVERSLVRRTSTLVACSPAEARLAAELGHRRVVTVPNRVDQLSPARARHAARPLVVTAGRVGPQKDWRHLLTVKRYLEEVLRHRVDWLWLGGGDEAGERALRADGVTVTGWLPRDDVLRGLVDAQVYVHTAAWEGAPISILEAAGTGLPITARGISSLVSLAVPGVAATAADLAARIVRLHDPAVWAAEQQRSLFFAASHSIDEQRARLHEAYRHAPALALS